MTRRTIAKSFRSDGGFTILELIIAITLTGIILVALGFAVTESLQNTTATKTSIDRSEMANFAARYFGADVASAAYGPSSIDTTSAPVCVVGSTSASTAIDIQTGPSTVVSYAVVPAATTGQSMLVRAKCSGTIATTMAQTSSRTIGTSDNSLVPTATCTTSSCTLTLTWASPTFSLSVSGSRWVDATTTTTTAGP